MITKSRRFVVTKSHGGTYRKCSTENSFVVNQNLLFEDLKEDIRERIEDRKKRTTKL